MEIRQTVTEKDKAGLDELLWQVLWQPLGMTRDTRAYFTMDHPEVEVIALEGGEMVGGLVYYRVAADLLRIRQLAVREDFRNRGIGGRLMTHFLEGLKPEAPLIVDVVVRSPALVFYRRLGFLATGYCPEHPDFGRNGLTLHEMTLKIV